MLHIGSMGKALHGVDKPNIRKQNPPARDHGEDEEKVAQSG
jgi:hypothetical protein